MKAFCTQLFIQFKSDLRDKGVLMVYYIVPMAFYLIMGSIMKTLELDEGNSLILSITIFALSMSAFLGMPQSLVKARENGVLIAYRVAGIPSWSLPLSTIIISFVHIMIVAIIILFSAPYLYSAAWPTNIMLYLLSVAIVAICSEALGALISCLVKKQSTLTLVGQLLFLPTVMFSGIMFPSNLLPRPMQLIGAILPATQGLRLITMEGMQVLPLIILLGITILTFLISIELFRRISVRA
ncbi:MAG: type transporter [Sedimentibacter sp.]|jgi:ABC-2 type transport system permease protein|nr:type transporter [Sedimentibacter sp.]